MRYFLEVSYKGTNYSGFQSQKNANTIQDEIEKALFILLRQNIRLTGSSRTDAGVHALQNYFHFDSATDLSNSILYNLNAILPSDIVCKNIIEVKSNAHCRFDAISREYKYIIYQQKNPFLKDTAFYFPYSIDFKAINGAAYLLMKGTDFTSFSKKNTQVKNFVCKVYKSEWYFENQCLYYHIIANRFLRGMVRALTATMLKVGRGKLTLSEFKAIIDSKDSTKTNFAAPAQGLQLVTVQFPDDYFSV